jgi:hypothetical protein
VRDQLTHKSVVVLESDDALPIIAGNGLGELDLSRYKALYPETDGAGEYGEGSDGYLAAALSSPPCIRPWKERKKAPRTSLLITKVEVIGGRVIEVYGTLDEPKAEDSGVEIEISLGIARDTGDVVNTGSAEAHRIDSCLASFRGLALIAAGTRGSPLPPITALVLDGVRWDVFGVWLARPGARIAVALLCRGFCTLFPLSSGWHNISNRHPSIEATDMPFAEAMM